MDKIFSEVISLKCALILADNAVYNTYELPKDDTVAVPLVRIRPAGWLLVPAVMVGS